MRIVKVPFLVQAVSRYPNAKKWIENWRSIVQTALWKNLHELRKTYPSADAVKVRSGRTVTVFNVGGNDYRLLVAIHYNRGIIYTLRFLTHAEYSKDHRKSQL